MTAPTTSSDSRARGAAAAPPAPWLAPVMALVGLGAMTVAALGPLGADVIHYHVSSGASEQIRGGDLAGLVLVGPLGLAAATLLLRRHPGAEALALAPATYGLYMYSQLAIGGDVARYPGNAERFFPLFWALVVLCGSASVALTARLLSRPAPRARPALERTVSVYLLLVATFLTVGLHLPGLRDAWRAAPSSEEYLADPVVFWVVKLMDLGYVVPVVVAAAVALWLERSWARSLMAPVVGWSALLASSVAGMGVSMLATDSPGASPGLAGGFVLAAATALALALAAYRPWFAGSRPEVVTAP